MDRKVFFGVIIALIVVSAVLTAGCVSNETEKKTYIVGVDGDYPPYSYVDESGKFVGFDVESVKWIAEQEGFNVEIKAVAWDGIIPALLAGKIDMVYSGMTITPARATQVNFSIPYWSVDQGVAVKKGSTVTLDQFKAGDLTIGVQRSCSADQYIQSDDFFGEATYNRMVRDGMIKLYDTFPQSMVALENGLVQTVIFDDVNIKDYIKGKDASVMLGTIPTGEEYGVAMRKDDTKLHALMNDGIAKLMASDKWDELLSKYLIEA
ncbi:MAG TPA: transporter substrate-binding domain-containing protein [Methanocorpusculum sp.]|nr:transporter substrate-binding domain-containing protein [Methanocorpusculum sp.]HJJ51223.1 transporter substrate-binding domain-containing protein [Methanocorpusculum sp.]